MHWDRLLRVVVCERLALRVVDGLASPVVVKASLDGSAIRDQSGCFTCREGVRHIWARQNTRRGVIPVQPTVVAERAD